MMLNLTKSTHVVLALSVCFSVSGSSRAQVQREPYPAMAPLDSYTTTDESAEISLARSAAPATISNKAEVLLLRRDGYATVVKGTNGFVCLVERSWANTTDDPQFWNPRMRAPHCLNAAAAKSLLPAYLMKTKLALGGKSRSEIAAFIASARKDTTPPEIEPGAMVYMLSKQQYLNDSDQCWHPHLMFYASGRAAKSWGANLQGSPVLAAYDSEQQLTTFFVPVGRWSDGSPEASSH